MSRRKRRGGKQSGFESGNSGMPADDMGWFGQFINKLLVLAEKDRANILTAFLIIFALGAIRSVTESLWFDYYSFSLYVFIEHQTFAFVTFIAGAFILSFFAKNGIKKAVNVVLFGYWIILLPPFVDVFLLGRSGAGQGYPYRDFSETARLFFTFINWRDIEVLASIGEMVQLWSMIMFSALYVGVKTGFPEKLKALFRQGFRENIMPFLRSASKVFGVMLTLWIFIVLISTTLFLVISVNPEGVFSLGRPVTVEIDYYSFLNDVYVAEFGYNLAPWRDAVFVISQQIQVFISVFYLLLFLLFTSLMVHMNDRGLFREIMRSIKGLRASVLLAVSFIGIVSVQLVDPTFERGLALDPLFALHLPYIVLALLTVFFCWQYSSMVNDIYDREEDEKTGKDRPLLNGKITLSQYAQISIFYALLALCTGFTLGVWPFMLTIAFLAIGTMYSVPPFRLRERGFSKISFGLAAVLSFLIGYLSPTIWILRPHYFTGLMGDNGLPIFDDDRVLTVTIDATPPVSFHIVVIIATIFIATSVVSLAHAHKLKNK